jgi:3-phosphoshikimate 1-carboxyvinyltransferase
MMPSDALNRKPILPLSLPNGLQGSITVPGDKSMSHRALLLSALTEGVSEVWGLLPSADVFATKRCLERLGVQIACLNEAKGHWQIRGRRDWKEPSELLDCGNSGTTIRLMMGLIAGHNLYAVLSGDVSLNKRPMGRVMNPLRQMGSKWAGRDNNQFSPLVHLPVAEGLQGIQYTMPMASAQVKSAVLLAGLFAKTETRVTEPIFSRDHTERMLKAMGADLEVHGKQITLAPNQIEALAPMAWQVPSDPSSVAFGLVATLLCPNSQVIFNNVGLNPRRIGLFEALKQVGASIEYTNQREVGGEPVGDLVVTASELVGNLTLSAEDIPALVDEIPILTMAGLYLKGTLTIRGAEELRKKESDRLLALQVELAKLGYALTLFEDGLTLTGNPDRVLPVESTKPLETWHDHRIAMAFTILNLIHNARCPKQATQWPMLHQDIVTVSYPSFFEHLQQLTQQAVG